MRKRILGIVALAAIAAPLAFASSANAADGDKPLNITFEGGVSTVAGVGATTEFTLAPNVQGNWGNAGTGTMYDPGTYAIGSNPRDFHELWVDWAGATDNMLFVNGFTEEDQTVLSASVPGVTCTTAGSNVTYTFSANMVNILPLGVASDGGAEISVYINDTLLGEEKVLTNDPSHIIEIVGSVPASNPMAVTIVNNGTAYSGNDFAIDDITLTQNGECEPPCETTTNGVWHNYTGKFTGTGTPALDDPKWKALPAQPGGEHDLTLRGFDSPYNPGADKGKGDWFVWKDLGTTCPGR